MNKVGGRARNLERRIADAGAIRFDVDNGATGTHWLDVLTTGISPDGHGIFLHDTGGAGIQVTSTASVGLAGAGVVLDSSGGLNLANATAGDIDIAQSSSGDVNVTATSGDIFIETSSGAATFESGGPMLIGGDTVQVSIPAGISPTVKFYVEAGAGPIFEVRQDGSVHSRGPVIADL